MSGKFRPAEALVVEDTKDFLAPPVPLGATEPLIARGGPEGSKAMIDWGRTIVVYGDVLAAMLLATGLFLLWLSRGKRLLPRLGLGLAAMALNFPAVYWFIAAPGHLRPIRASFAAAGKAAPELVFERIPDRARVRLSDYRGRVVVLNLWSTWCGPCRREMPALERLHRDYTGRGAVVIAVSDQTFEEIGSFTPLQGMSLVAGRVDAAAAPRELFVEGGVMRPITHIIDRSGVLRETLLGEQSYSSVAARIGKYLP